MVTIDGIVCEVLSISPRNGIVCNTGRSGESKKTNVEVLHTMNGRAMEVGIRFETGNTPVCDRIFEYVESITAHVVPRK